MNKPGFLSQSTLFIPAGVGYLFYLCMYLGKTERRKFTTRSHSYADGIDEAMTYCVILRKAPSTPAIEEVLTYISRRIDIGIPSLVGQTRYSLAYLASLLRPEDYDLSHGAHRDLKSLLEQQ